MTRSKYKISEGDRFTDWTVLSKEPFWKDRYRFCLCQCKCGKKHEVNIWTLVRKESLRCMSCAAKRNHSKRYRSLAGRRFGKLRVVRRAEKHDYKRNAYWLCTCECGNMTMANRTQLTASDPRRRRTHCGCSRPRHHITRRSVVLKYRGKVRGASEVYATMSPPPVVQYRAFVARLKKGLTPHEAAYS